MRLAIAAPSFSSAAIHGRQIDAVLNVLARRHDTEFFVESTRLHDARLDGARYHYLRLAERNTAAPFDAALYPIGRDFRPSEPGILQARRFPSVVWALDTVLHHLDIGGTAVRGRWDSYADYLIDAFPERGMAVSAAVASGWGTRALFRRSDPFAYRLRRQRAVVAASSAVARWLEDAVGEVACAPLPIDSDALGVVSPGDPAAPVKRLLVLSSNITRPEPGLRALAALRLVHPALEVDWCVPAGLHDVFIVPVARRLGVLDFVRWHESPDDGRYQELVDAADAVVSLSVDPTLAECSLLRRAQARAAAVMVMDVEPYADFATGEVARIEPGRLTAASFESVLGAVLGDAGFAAALRRAGSAARHDDTGAAVGADALESALERARCRQPVATITAPVWTRLRERHERLAQPANAAPGVRARVAGALERILPGAAHTDAEPAGGS